MFTEVRESQARPHSDACPSLLLAHCPSKWTAQKNTRPLLGLTAQCGLHSTTNVSALDEFHLFPMHPCHFWIITCMQKAPQQTGPVLGKSLLNI